METKYPIKTFDVTNCMCNVQAFRVNTITFNNGLFGSQSTQTYHNPTLQNHTITLYSHNTCKYINSRTILVTRNTLTKQLYIISETRPNLVKNTPPPPPPATARGHHPSCGSLLHRQREVAIPGPLPVAWFVYNTSSPTTISEYIDTIVRSLHYPPPPPSSSILDAVPAANDDPSDQSNISGDRRPREQSDNIRQQ